MRNRMFHRSPSQNSEKKKTKKGEKRTGVKILTVVALILFSIGILFFLGQSFGLRTWGGLKLDEMVFHMVAPKEGTENSIISSAIRQVFLPGGLIIAAAVTAAVLIWKKKPGLVKKIALAELGAGVFLASFSVVHFLKMTDGFSYIRSQYSVSDFIEKNYADPATTTLTFPEKKRNLVYIYLESVETTFSDPENGGAFPENCIPELTELAQGNDDFSGSSDELNGGEVLNNTGYTMGAIFAETTGLPLQTNLYNAMDTQSGFFSGVQAIGDILENEGYSQAFLCGSESAFGGRKLYFTDHGNYEIMDYDWAKQSGHIPEDYKAWWGFEDEKLFSFAREKLQEMASADKPFNLTLLTVDTHFEDGYRCRLCGDEFGDNQYANVMACSSRQVTEFVRWIQDQDFYKDTTIVISGDHTTMDQDFCQDVPDDYTRKTYTCVVNSAVEPADPDRRPEFSTMDLFPTTLAAMGVKIEGERLGLGTNLYSDLETLTEKYGFDELNQEMLNKSTFLQEKGKVEVNQALLDRILSMVTLSMDVEGNTVRFRVDGLNISDRQEKQVTVWLEPETGGGGTLSPFTSLNADDLTITKGTLPASETEDEGVFHAEMQEGDSSIKFSDRPYFSQIENAVTQNGVYRIRVQIEDEDGTQYYITCEHWSPKSPKNEE